MNYQEKSIEGTKKYEERFRSEILYSIPHSTFVSLVIEEYKPGRHSNKIKDLLWGAENNHLMNIRKTADPDIFKWRGEELAKILQGKWVKKLHYIILVDLAARDLIPEGTYVISS